MDTENFVYVYLDHILLPPLEGGQEPESGEWLKVPAQKHGDRYILPHADIIQNSRAVVSDEGRIILFLSLPINYMRYTVSKDALNRLDDLAWDTKETRCKDCPEWPWKTVLDPEVVQMRMEDHSGSCTAWYEKYRNPDLSTEPDLSSVRKLIMDEYLAQAHQLSK